MKNDTGDNIIIKTILFFIIPIELYTMTNVCVHQLSFIIVLKVAYYFLCCVIIPGLALIKVLKFSFSSFLESAILIYTLGLSVTIVEYFILMLCGFKNYSFYVSIVIFIIALLKITKQHQDYAYSPNNAECLICLALISCSLILCFLSVSLVTSLPDETGGTGYYVDHMYWVMNNMAATKAFPISDFALSGNDFRYYFFSSIILAQFHNITGIEILHISFYLSPAVVIPLMVTSVYIFFGKFLSRRSFRVIGTVLALFTEGTVITYEYHMFFIPIGFDYGMSFGLLAVTQLPNLLADNDSKKRLQSIIISMIAIALTTGSKMPLAIVILLLFGLFTLVRIFYGKLINGVCDGFLWLSSFLLVYFLFIAKEYSSNQLGYVGIKGAFYKNHYISEIFSDVVPHVWFFTDYIRKILSVALYVILSNVVGIVLLLISIIGCFYIFRRHIKEYLYFCIVLTCVITLYFGLTIYGAGAPNVYLLMAVIPFETLAGLYAIEKFTQSGGFWRGVSATLTLVFGIYSIIFVSSSQWYKKIQEGYLLSSHNITTDYYISLYGRVFYVSEKKYNAYRWIRDNVGEDEILAINFIQNENIYNSFCVEAFSEHQVWNDGLYSYQPIEVEKRDEILKNAMNGDDEAISNMVDENVNYILYFKLNTNDEIYNDRQLDRVYENEEVLLYHVQSN